MQWIYLMLVFVPVYSHYTNSTGTSGNLISTPCIDKNHFFLAPGVLTAGGTNRACISRFYPDGSARMLLSLIAEDKQTVTASRELPPGDGGCLDISVPLLPNTKADLVVNIWYPEIKCTWERRITVRISSGRVVVVHTERARYRPGETLRARVFALKADLTPAPGNIEEIWIEGPPGAWEGTRVAQWTKVRSKMGLAQVQHDIDELAPPGRWTVRARLGDGSQGSSVFWVGNYELPPFQLTVRHAPRVLRTSERLVWTVCVRYPWTEAVEGMLVIRLRGAGSNSSGVRTAVRLRAPRACHRHAAAARRVGLGGEHPPDVVVADFSFQEEGTRIWQNTTVVSQVVDKPISLEFVTRHRTVISPGLPYKLKVKATRWDDKPAPNERVRVCRFSSRDDRATETNVPTCASGDTDASGVARIMFADEDDGSAFYRFEASLSNDSATVSTPLTLRSRRSAPQVALGPLRVDSRGTRTFLPLYLTLQNISTPITVHFVVITRGGVIYRWGATTQCPIASSSTQIQTAPRNSKCNDPVAQYNEEIRRKKQYDENMSSYDKNKNPHDKKNINNNEHDKRSRIYDANTNQFVNQKQNLHDNKNDNNSGFIIRNMNQNDKNNYLNKNVKANDKNHTVYDRFSSVFLQPDIYDKVIDVNSIQYEANASDALLDRHLLRVMLPIKVTQQMCPDSHLIAYFYYNGEFVSASKHFEMDDCFVNKVEATFLSRQAPPGSQATLHLTTPGPSLCALTALDSAAKYTPHDNVKEVLMNGLRRMIDGHRNITEYDAAGDCFLDAETPQLPSNTLELTATWLAAAGVRVAGDVTVRTSCDSPAAALVDEGTVPRSDFSEAWLWRLVTVGANGTALTTAKTPDSITRYEANAVCLSKTGVAVSQPAILQVFREFFIHADSPRRLRRGDSTIIRYRLFNYLYEPLSVQTQLVTSSHLQAPPSLVESTCIPPRSSSARRVSITASDDGDAKFIIRAKAVSDGGCGNSTSRRGVSDEVVMKITVEPEGVPIQEHRSMLLCGTDKSNSAKSEVSWSWSPATIVPGTETLTVWATGDIVGPLLADADSLVLLPRGCGEQNMARLATNLVALSRLSPHSGAALAATLHVARGFTRQLQYIHPSGGFSAFGASDATSSTWLTAFSLRYLRRAHKMLWPTEPIPPAIEKAERWLLNQQMENGCFRNEGQVFHRELRGGLNEEGEIASVALTAYVITSLTSPPSPLPPRTVRSTLACLRALPPPKRNTPARVYAHSLLAYAFISLKKYEEDLRRTNEAKYEDLRRASRTKHENRSSDEASWLIKGGLKENEGLLEVMELVKMARREGEYLWWETGSLSSSIEATGYALLALSASAPALRELGAGAVRWLEGTRGARGGFLSTQDTLVALEALSAWSSLQPSPANLTVSARSGTVSKLVKLDSSVRVPELLKMGTGDKISIGVEGSGCALVQATRSYNSPSSDVTLTHKRLSVQLSVHTDGTFDCDATAANCFCAAVIEACAVWSGSFPEMALMEITLPGGYGADASKLYSQLNLPNSLLRRIELAPTSTRATLYLAARDGGDTTPRHGHACYNIHIVGPQAKTRPAYVRIMDYYNPTVNDTQIYTIPEECPPRISHELGQDITSDNLYNNARSLSDDGEILITHEFSFEDIPEGIPLEDPLYDNLTKKDKEKSDLRRNENNTDEINKSFNIKYDNQLPYISVSDKDNEQNKNINNLNKNTENENLGQRDKDQISDKLDLDDTRDANHPDLLKTRNFVQIKPNKAIETSFESKDIRIDMFYKALDTKHEVEDSEKTSRDNVHTNIYNEKQKSITETTTEENTQLKIVNNPKPDNEINKEYTNPNHRIEIRDEHESNPQVDNPKLTDFHVIDSEKDLEVPSGLEGPVPVIVLPPTNFIPPQHLTPPDNYYVPQNAAPNNFVPYNGASNSFTPQETAPNNFVPQNAANNNFVPFNTSPNNFVPQNAAPKNYVPQNAANNNIVPQYAAHNNYVSQNFWPSFYVPTQSFAANDNVYSTLSFNENMMRNYVRRRN